MKTNPIRLLFAVFASAALFGQSVGATTFLTEEFQYASTGQLGASGTGSGTTPPSAWNTPQPGIYYTNGSHSLDGTALGLVQSFGGSVSLLGYSNGTTIVSGAGTIVPNGCYNKFFQSGGVINPNNTTNLYTSFLLRFNTASGITNGSFIAQMNLQSGGIQSASGADAYWQVLARTNGSQVQLGIAKNCFNNTASGIIGANAGVTNWDATLVSPNQTFLVVVRLQLNDTNASNVGGSIATNVEDDLWINPPPATLGTNEDNVPVPDITSPIGDGTIPSSATGPGRLFLVDSFAVATIDEIRIASTWAEVTPPVGQCIGAEVVTDPTNVTQTAEIPTILSCSFIGTGATNQWQISHDSGATWSTIPGAIQATYITPNLQYPADNGTQYRCVVGVSCDNSSDTSGAATVTLNPTTPTAAGVIMNDPFTSPIFNYPVTPVSSVWFSLLDANQVPYFTGAAVNGSGAQANTITNSSTLYVGYFVDQNAAPIDLAIGSAIRVTFPFTPKDFSLFTGNGPLRFGLYDYRDLGTPIPGNSTALTGSAGQGYGVMGYMLSLDFGTNFTDTTPLNLYARVNLLSPGLASSTGDYTALDSGPAGGVSTNVPAFQDGVNNTLIFTVTRTATNSCAVAVTITNANGLNISFSTVDTSLGWHRFDSFALRPNSGVSSCADFFIPSFKVEVLSGITVMPTSITITNISLATNSITLGWQPVPSGGTYGYTVLTTTNLSSGPWVTNVAGLTTNTYTDNATTTNNVKLFYRVRSPY